MKKFLHLVLFCVLTVFEAQSQLWTEDFETNGLGTNYTSASVFTNNVNAHYNRTNGSTISNVSGPYTNKHGSYLWAGENQNDATVGGNGLALKTITFTAINVTGQTNLQFRGLFGSGNTANGHDYSDAFYAEYRMDAGAWTKFLQFATPSMSANTGLYYDADLNGIGEGQVLTPQLQQFVFSIPVTGLSLQFRITSINNAVGEEIAFDYLRLYNTTAPVAGCINPLGTNFNPAATVDNGTCTIAGCTNPTALNYSASANSDNGTCVFTVPDVVINEVHYNPSSYANFADNVYEFIELYNNTNAAVYIGGWRVGNAIDVTIPAGTVMAAHSFILVAPATNTYIVPGVPVFQYSGTLTNTGDYIKLYTSANVVVDQVSYFPTPPWPAAADGNGPSLELINYNIDNSQVSSWCTGSQNNGTPGVQNSCYTPLAGCMDLTASNYNSLAQISDGSCVYLGCTYPAATNYNPIANQDNGSCLFTGASVCTGDLNGDHLINVSDLLIFLGVFGTICP